MSEQQWPAIKVLLVEDEQIILEGLRRLVDWEGLGYTIAGTADSYEAAISEAYITKPDLILTDIMLGEGQSTGLDLIKKLRPLMPRTKSVLLTGYDSFDFAKEAIRYTVRAYLLKPITEGALTECLAGVREEFHREWAEEREKAALHEQVRTAQPFLFDWVFSLGQGDEESVLALPEGCAGYGVIAASFGCGTGLSQQQLYALFLEMESLRGFSPAHCLFFFRHAQFVCVLGHGPEARPEEMDAAAYELAREMQQFLDFHQILDYVIGVGLTAHSPAGVRESFEQAQKACSYQQFTGRSKLVCYADLSLFPQKCAPRFRDIWEPLSVAVHSGDADAATQAIRVFFAGPAAEEGGIGRLRGLGYESMVLLDELRLESGMEQAGYGEAIARCESLAELVETVCGQYAAAAEHFAQRRASRNSAALGQVRETILRDYAQNLTLEELAQSVYLSPSYLSYLFSLEMGKTFKTYLTDVRMAKAQELLYDLGLKVYEVAERVGYTDTRYFGQVFKKATGSTPLQYRNEKAGQ